MIAVIQCASRKRSGAGHLTTTTGQPITFVAHPTIAPASDEDVYARPDDMSADGRTWREALLKYNDENAADNPLRLLPAWRLYENPVYARLLGHFGIEELYILSAGWGLIRADFLTPYYDITFSANAEAHKRRRRQDRYEDLRMLPATRNEIVFFGSVEYVHLFCTLTSDATGPRTVFYRTRRAPEAPGCVLRRFETTTRTNWQYECAHAFLDAAPMGFRDHV